MSLSTELVLAAASGSTDGLGLIVDIPTSATLYVRCPGAGRVDWQVKCNRARPHQLRWYLDQGAVPLPIMSSTQEQ